MGTDGVAIRPLCVSVLLLIFAISFSGRCVGHTTLSDLVHACAFIGATTPQRSLKVQLPCIDLVPDPEVQEEMQAALEAAGQLWRDLTGRVDGPSSVVVTNVYGRPV